MDGFVINQIHVFFIFTFCGAIIGVLFDFFRILRKSFKTPDWITYIEDVLFWFLTCIILAYTIFKYNNGELRAFLFIGLLIGFVFYMFLFSKKIIEISVQIINSIRKVLKLILNVLIIPLRMLFIIIRKVFLRPISFVFINIRSSIKKNLSKIVKRLWKNNAKKVQTRKDFIWICRILFL